MEKHKIQKTIQNTKYKTKKPTSAKEGQFLKKNTWFYKDGSYFHPALLLTLSLILVFHQLSESVLKFPERLCYEWVLRKIFQKYHTNKKSWVFYIEVQVGRIIFCWIQAKTHHSPGDLGIISGPAKLKIIHSEHVTSKVSQWASLRQILKKSGMFIYYFWIFVLIFVGSPGCAGASPVS